MNDDSRTGTVRSPTKRAVGADATGTLPPVVGRDLEVDCLDGIRRRYVNLDPAASTPALVRVVEAIEEFLPWYSSVHRGAGTKSMLSTAAYEGAREAIRAFVGAGSPHEVIITENTTHATNMLAALLPTDARILSSAVEHHANMLPWRRHPVDLLPFTASPAELVAEARRMLAAQRYDLVAVTGASNVTGELWPIAQLAEAAHEHGAEIFVDAAQLAPHRAIDMSRLGIDHLAISGHKLYAPYGAGALVSLRARLERSAPWVHGGGAVRFVTPSEVVWADPPERHEAGSPNVVGAVALGVACDALTDVGMESVAAHERALADRLWSELATIDGLTMLTEWPAGTCERVGVATFTLDGYPDRLLAQVLAAEHAIGVRNGCFCAHPLIVRLLDIDEKTAACIRDEVAAGDSTKLPGAVRVSLGVANCAEDVDRVVAAIRDIAARGPRGDYVFDRDANEYHPVNDTRGWPDLPVRLAGLPGVTGCAT